MFPECVYEGTILECGSRVLLLWIALTLLKYMCVFALYMVLPHWNEEVVRITILD